MSKGMLAAKLIAIAGGILAAEIIAFYIYKEMRKEQMFFIEI